MTPEQAALRDAFLAECWAPVREYRQTDGERADAYLRQQGVNRPVDERAEGSGNAA